MQTLKVRIGGDTASFLDRIARETGRTKAEVVRDALEALRNQNAKPATVRPSEAMAHLIGSWDSGVLQLSERTGERFAQLLDENRRGQGTRGRRIPGRNRWPSTQGARA